MGENGKWYVLWDLVEAIGSNKKVYKILDEVVNEKQININEEINSSEIWKEKQQQGLSIERRYYSQKCQAIISRFVREESEDGKDYERFIKRVIKEGWRYAYTYIEQNKTVRIEEFAYRFGKKFGDILCVDQYFNQLIVFWYLASMEKKLEENESSKEIFKRAVASQQMHLVKSLKYDFNNLSKEEKLKAKNILKALKMKLSNINQDKLSIGNRMFTTGGDENNRFKIKDCTLTQLLGHTFQTIPTIFNVEIAELEKYENDKALTEIAYLISILIESGKMKNIPEGYDLNKMSDEAFYEIINIFYPALIVRGLFEMNQDSTNFFFNNYQQGLQENLNLMHLECRGLKKERLILNDKYEGISEENRRLKREIEQLSLKNKKLEENQKELNSLRNYIFKDNNANEIENDDLTQEEINIINKVEGIIFGGTDKWRSRMKDILPKWNFISPDSMNFDKKILKTKKQVVINTSYISHAMYYKVLENSDNIFFINSTNVEITLKNIKQNGSINI